MFTNFAAFLKKEPVIFDGLQMNNLNQAYDG